MTTIMEKNGVISVIGFDLDYIKSFIKSIKSKENLLKVYVTSKKDTAKLLAACEKKLIPSSSRVAIYSYWGVTKKRLTDYVEYLSNEIDVWYPPAGFNRGRL